ncbi:MAG: membrane protein insertase YidC [Acidobacteria bacterium]|nr:membrane protein insertase YidC [Acidobacteriota bacterium]
METRRLLLAAVLSMAVLLLWQRFFPAPAPVTAPAAESAGAEPVSESPSAVRPTTEPAAAPAAVAVGESMATGPPTEATVSQEIVLENELARAVWSNRGAQLTSFELKGHPANGGGDVDMVRRRQAGLYPFALVDGGGAGLLLNDALFAVERRRDGVSFSYRGAAGSATKTFDLREDGMLEVTVQASGDWRLLIGPGIRNPSEAEGKTRFARRAAVYLQASDVERIDAQGADEPTVINSTALSWIGLQDQYFLAAVLPREGLRDVLVEPMLFDLDESGAAAFRPRPIELSGTEEDLGVELRLLLSPVDDRLAFDAYFGSKQVHRLSSLPGGLEQAVELGFFGFLARPLLVALRWIHDNIVGNYGWAIILLTMLLRIVLFPLNHKSIVSMQKMQNLNPKMQAIKAKYRSKLKDKKGRPNADASAKQNQEIMALYKQEGVNPAAGCLPMLLQMPVLFSFYSLLSAAVELRRSPWLGWIRDLSAPDPWYVLPIVMGVSMLVQQRMAPTQGDAMQRRMFMFMPIIFTVLFLGFPAGMVLYWLTNNVLAIAQQAGYKRWRAARESAVSDSGSK